MTLLKADSVIVNLDYVQEIYIAASFDSYMLVARFSDHTEVLNVYQTFEEAEKELERIAQQFNAYKLQGSENSSR
jgi:hypothetical protein